jgi:carbamoyl-phosphate synthase large subunit
VQAFQRASQALGLGLRTVACDVSERAPALYAADDHVLVPRVDDAGYVERLLTLCDEQSVALLVPTIDPELPVLAAAAGDFHSVGTHVLVPHERATRIAADKRETNAFLRCHDIGTVAQWPANDVAAASPRPRGPLVAKPARGSAGIGVTVLAEAPDHSSFPEDLVIEELAAGREHTMDVYVDRHGECISVVPRERLEVRAGEVSKGITRDVPALVATSRRIASALQVQGCVLTVQAFHDEATDIVRVIEINARFGGGFPLALEAGADFPEWLLREHVMGQRLEPRDSWTRDLLMLRYDAAVFLRR